MAVNVGTYSIGEVYVGSNKIKEAYIGSELVYKVVTPKTFRFKFSSTSFNPSTTLPGENITWTAVNQSSGTWDATSTISGDSWAAGLFEAIFTVSTMGSVTCSLVAANTRGMTSCNHLFDSCDALSSICKMDFSAVTSMGYCFNGCKLLTEIPLLDLHAVTTATNAFQGCIGLTSIPTFDLGNLEEANYMFTGCHFTTVPNWQLGKLTRAAYMFTNCSELTSVPNFGTLPSITFVPYMFSGCRKVQSGALAMYNILSARITSPASRYTRCFTNCGADTVTGAQELLQIPTGWK